MPSGFPSATLIHLIVAAFSALIFFPLFMRLGWQECQKWLVHEPVRIGLLAQQGAHRTWAIVSLILACFLAFSINDLDLSWAPLVDQPTATVTIDAAAHVAAGVVTGWVAALLTSLARIDLLTRLLPDRLTLSLLGLGVLVHALDSLNADTIQLVSPLTGLSSGVGDSLLGAAAGFLLPAGFSWAYGKWRGKTVMGRGDLFFIAALGAWLGWQALPVLLFLSSAITLTALLLVGLIRRSRRHAFTMPSSLPLGPGLSTAAAVIWLTASPLI